MTVFDTSAVLAIVYNEDGRSAAQARLDDSAISTVNVAEVLRDMMVSSGDGLDAVYELFSRLPISVVSPDLGQAKRVAELKSLQGLSLGDCFCIALAESRRTPVITADQDWADLDLAVPVELIRTTRHSRKKPN
jgi:PIN domain nuclease of toxin-antitoxin system